MRVFDKDDPFYEEPTEAKPKRHREPFVQISHNSLVAGSEVLHGSKQFLVWAYIHYKVWQEKQNTVGVSNAALRDWGVERHTKYAALRLLEEAGLIKVERPNCRSLRVTLLAA